MGYVRRQIDPLTASAMRELGTVLRILRTSRGLTQRELAMRSGVSQSTISRLENGLAPGVRVFALARVLGGLERQGAFDRAAWEAATPPGWRVMLEAFSTKGAFATTWRGERERVARQRAELLAPRRSNLEAIRPRARPSRRARRSTGSPSCP